MRFQRTGYPKGHEVSCIVYQFFKSENGKLFGGSSERDLGVVFRELFEGSVLCTRGFEWTFYLGKHTFSCNAFWVMSLKIKPSLGVISGEISLVFCFERLYIKLL